MNIVKFEIQIQRYLNFHSLLQSECKFNTMRLELVCYRQPGLESQIWTELRSGQWTEEEINVQSRA